MSRYIDADKLYDDSTKIRINLMQDGVDITPIWQVLDCIRQQPTADVRENVKGHWIDKSQGVWVVKQCSACNGICDYQFNFCPYCGADMRGEA